MKRIDQIKGTFDTDKDKKRVNPSDATVRRLPRYYRYLSRLLADNILRISSSELAKRMGVNPSQIRQDLSCFGDFGQQGYGYNVRYLYNKIAHILGMTDENRAVFIGWGDTARALLATPAFTNGDVSAVAVFADPIPCDISLPAYPLASLKEALPHLGAAIAIVTTPSGSAQDLLFTLSSCGVRGVLNYTGATLTTPTDNMTVQNVYLDDPCMLLCYHLGRHHVCEE